MTSHGSATCAGAGAGALVGTFIFPGLGREGGALIGAVSGFIANGVRMCFYQVEDPDSGDAMEAKGELVFFGYISNEAGEPHPHWGKLKNPHWNAGVATALTGLAITGTIRWSTKFGTKAFVKPILGLSGAPLTTPILLGELAGEGFGFAAACAVGANGESVEASQRLGGHAGAICTGAAAGALIAGPVGAVAGAGIGAGFRAMSGVSDVVVGGVIGQASIVYIVNKDSAKRFFYSHPSGEIVQQYSYDSLELGPGEAGMLRGRDKAIRDGDCIYVHVYDSEGATFTPWSTVRQFTRDYGIKMSFGRNYQYQAGEARQFE